MRRAARHGRPHPDPYVARLAHAWAAEVLRTPGPRPSRTERIAQLGPGAALLAVVGALLGPAAAGSSLGGGLSWRERRLARRILGLSPHRLSPPDAEPAGR